ncbi:MAG: hypothetical protein A2857_00775 [Candidatus Levybacteria bacterium RIFCSPHIGHO2_01_FULL_36_15]|nr:MAG: hypothetical protein A2857_00775 [Candidatus Levybacteria bacterium RIFCSPHIGHO2_01_FULL_36_15]
MVNQNIFTLKIGGQAGQGIKSAGLMLAKVATRSGYYTYTYTEYPSLIRGGHNVMQINVSSEEVTAPSKKTDFLIALNQQTINLHSGELIAGSGVLFDSEKSFDIAKVEKGVNLYPVPLSKFANSAGGGELLSNTVALGAATAILDGNLSMLKNLINEEFANKDPKVATMNQQAAEAGFNFAQENFAENFKKTLTPIENNIPKMVVNGNDAVALGAIAAGLQFAAIYPMSPISNILHVLASYQEKYGYVYKQPEDEISAINMAIGASFAGVRSMTATSGGGFCLMTEAYGLSGMTETPIVIVLGMRPGPATGFPTWSEQGDLRFVLHAHQGDFPRIVLAPGDAKEAFDLTMQAFNLADKYQTPVVLLIDKNICEDDQSFPVFNISSYETSRGKFSSQNLPDYKRFSLEDSGISMRTIPGTGNFFVANSDEHDEQGLSNEEAANRNSQMKKRMNKLTTCTKEDMKSPQLFGPPDADITIVSWGNNKGSILQAMKQYNNVNFLHITWLNPFPAEAIKNILTKAKHIIDVECNFSGQMAGLIREKTGIEITDKLLKYDGRPIFPEEIAEKINSTIK